MIKAGDRTQVLQRLAAWTPEDVMELIVQLPLKKARKLFDWLPAGPSERVLAELRPEFRAVIMADETIERLREILERMPPEAARDTLAALPDAAQDALLTQFSPATDLGRDGQYARDTAGRVMTRQFLALPEDSTAGDAIAAIRAHADILRKLDDIYVVDRDGHLVGRLGVKRLLFVPPEARLGQIMRRDVFAVSADIDQEEVAHLATRKDLRSVPVIDKAGVLIGQITIDELRQITRDEAAEDLMHMSAVSADARPTDPIRRIVSGRLPWLLAGLIGASVAALVVGSYEEQLEQAAILAAFIPVVMSLAGNSGLQASAVTVQGLASGAVWVGELGWRFIRELCGALINGAIAGGLLAILVFLASQLFDIHDPLRLITATALSLLTVTTIAALVGAFVPVALHRFGFDPAVATGVFITTSNDVIGVLIFFLMAKTFYLD